MPRRPRGHIEKRGENRYRLWVPLGTLPNGEYDWHRESFRGTYEQAEARLTKLLNLYDTNQLVDDEGLTYGDYLDVWLNDAIKPPKQEQATYDANASIVEQHIKPLLGHVPLAKLQLLHIERFHTKLFEPGARKDGRVDEDKQPVPLGLETVRRIHATVRWSLADAVRWHLIPHNPAAEAKLPAKERKPKPTWKPAELKQYLKHIRENPWRPFILTLAFTGCRIGEAAALKWDDIDFDAMLIRFDEALKKPGRKPKVGSTKKDKVRTTPMHPLLADALREHRVHQRELAELLGPEWNRWDFVFTSQSPRGTPVDADNFRSRVWYTLQKAANVPRLKPHGLRHTFVTQLLADGVDPKYVADIVGHADPAFTLREYDHPEHAHHRAAIQAFGDKMAGSELGVNGESTGSEPRKSTQMSGQPKSRRSALQRGSRNSRRRR